MFFTHKDYEESWPLIWI